MDINKQEYKALVKNTAPKSPIFKNCTFAFLFGGAICAFGQLLFDFAQWDSAFCDKQEKSDKYSGKHCAVEGKLT